MIVIKLLGKRAKGFLIGDFMAMPVLATLFGCGLTARNSEGVTPSTW